MSKSYNKTWVLITVIFMDILAGAEVDLFIPSFPELQSQFGLTPFWVEALLSVNFIAFCLSLFFVGGLADRYGRKSIILIGLMIFIVGSALCFWATSFPFLFFGRFLQGLGAAAPATLCFLIISDLYPIKEQPPLLAMLNALVNISIGAAPVIGSYVTLYFHWQGNFFTLLVLGIIVAILTLLFIPNYKIKGSNATLSFREYIPILKSPTMVLLIVCIIFMMVPYWVFVGMAPILYIEDLGVSLTNFGYYQGALALLFGVGSLFAGIIVSRYSQRKMVSISAYISVFAVIAILMAVFLKTTNPLVITLSMLPYIVGSIIPITILYPLCFAFMPQAKGRVSALIYGARLLLSAVALEFAGYYYSGSFDNIGLIVAGTFLISTITFFMIVKNREIGLDARLS